MTDAPQTTNTPARRLLRRTEVCDRIAMKRSALDNMVRDGRFPPPVRLGSIPAWPEHEVDAWVDARIAERDACTGDVA